MLNLSDLIRKGGASREQYFGNFYGGPNDEMVCVLGAAIEGAKSEGLLDDDDDN